MPTRLLQCVLETAEWPMLAAVAESEGDETLCLLEFTDRPRLERELPEIENAFGTTLAEGRTALHDRLEGQLAEYLQGERRSFDLPLSTPGTPFQQRVWNALLEIPHGMTESYGDLAARIGSPGAQRAVGAANGANRVAIVIPCHRVIESGGGLRGYGGGVDRKRRLLEIEGAWPTSPTLFEPAAAR